MAPSRFSPSRGWQYLAVFAAILVASYAGWRYFAGAKTADATIESATASRRAADPAPIPVTVASVQKADFRVYLNGLGTV